MRLRKFCALSARLRLETLVDRIAPTIATIFTPATGLLFISGDGQPDTVTLSQDAAGNILLNGGLIPGKPTATNTVQIAIFAGGGDDSVTIDSGIAIRSIIDGSGGDDTLIGGAGDDTLLGGNGNDSMVGGAGSDALKELGDAGFVLTNTSLTGKGIDVLSGIEQATLTGGISDNIIDASTFSGSVLLEGGAGNDNLVGGTANDTLSGAAGNDTMTGGAGGDLLIETGDVNFTLTNISLTGVGTDVLSSLETAELTGGGGDNIIDTSAFSLGPVILNGAAGKDHLIAGIGNDTLTGDAGDDTITGGDGVDVLVEQGDVNFALTNSTLTGLGSDLFSGIEQVMLTGGLGNNLIDASKFTGGPVTLTGGAGNDTLFGGTFDDSLVGGLGNDSLKGTVGNDTLDAGDGTDTLSGGGGNDSMLGGLGNDVLNAGAGDDLADGNEGTDTVNGGLGFDRCRNGEALVNCP